MHALLKQIIGATVDVVSSELVGSQRTQSTRFEDCSLIDRKSVV